MQRRGWSDAARAASIASRQAKARFSKSGKRMTPQAWYHGGPPLHGTSILGKRMQNWKTGRWLRGKTFAATSFKLAKGFGLTNANARGQKQYVYRVSPSGRRSSALATQLGAVKLGSRPNYHYGRKRTGGIVLESKRPMRAVRVPSARGGASRRRF